MKVDDIIYFQKRSKRENWEYKLAKEIQEYCKNDKGEFERRLTLLASVKDNSQHQLQAGNFISELCTFEDLIKRGFESHWEPESDIRGVKSPDIYYISNRQKVPVEVKTLNLDKNEGSRLRSYQYHVPETDPDWDYFGDGTNTKCEKKLHDFFRDTEEKFRSFNNSKSVIGELYLYFFPSLHVRFRDGEDGRPTMKSRINEYAKTNLSKSIKYFVIDVLTLG